MRGTRRISSHRVPSAGSVDPVDRLLTAHPILNRLGVMIRRQQSELRDHCSEEAWKIHVRIEELINERMLTLADLLLKGAGQ